MRDVPDFPKPGILFRDITTVLRDPVAWRATVDHLCDAVDAWEFDVVVGIESRGFILGSALAYQLGVGFVPVRKPGKLPAAVHAVDYTLEYGIDSLEIHRDALEADHRVLVVDDLLATGGTAAATVRLVEACGAEVAGLAFLVELADLDGRAALAQADPRVKVASLPDLLTPRPSGRGTVDPLIVDWCRTHLGSPAVDSFFGVQRLSAVHGVRLADGREVVLKVRGSQPRQAACTLVHEAMWRAGIPCPQPLAGPHPLAVGESRDPGCRRRRRGRRCPDARRQRRGLGR